MKAITMLEAINAVEAAFTDYYLNRAKIPLRTRIHCDEANGDLLFMPAYMSDLGGMGIKIVSVFPNNINCGKPTISAVVLLNNVETGEPLAIMDATHLTALRTGAASGVATKYLANKQASKLALFGTGGQALRQLEAMLEIRPIEEVYLFDTDKNRVKDFVMLSEKELSRFNFKIKVANTPRDAVLDADIVVTATTSRKPVFSGNDFKPGAHINGMGSYTPEMQEIDETTITRADKIVIDSFEASFKEAGDLVIPIGKGRLRQEDIYCEIGKITCGEISGREREEEITFFKSVGIAAQDISVAKLIYENALLKGLGETVDIA